MPINPMDIIRPGKLLTFNWQVNKESPNKDRLQGLVLISRAIVCTFVQTSNAAITPPIIGVKGADGTCANF